MRTAPRLMILCLLAALVVPMLRATPLRAQERAQAGWPAEKCARYAGAWREATAKLGLTGIGRDFLSNHDAFLASGCQRPPDVCPVSREELALANVLVLRGMSLKLASTFFPFKCGG